jgi:hypothetical protein
MPGRVADLVAVAALATIVTLAIAAPVLRAPSERVFGMEIVGRHHDPFTVMAQFGRPVRTSVYAQPVTDVSGALLARASGPVAAYNWLVLLSFPLSAVAAYLLARHLGLSRTGATVAGMLYAFSPFHLAHAAYHPHIAQTQWLPLYLLALWRCVDRPSPVAVGFLGVAAMLVTLSNFYAGLIAAVITPVALAAYWLLTPRTDATPLRRLGISAGSLVFIAASGLAYVWYAADPVLLDRASFSFPRVDLFRYSATWWSYLVPPVAHPLLGATAQGIWKAADVRLGLLEQQVSVGWAVVALGVIAIYRWRVPHAGDGHPPAVSRVPILVVIALAALVCSLSPEWTIGTFTFVRPSALLYDALPMFRSYARFGVVVQLMAVLLAGIGLDVVRRAATRRARMAGLVLVVFAAGEYAVTPSTLSRDVLPTSAHRWVTRQPDRLRVLDCAPLAPDSASIQWLTARQVSPLTAPVTDCLEPELPRKLAAAGYTHLLVRGDTAEGRWFVGRRAPEGLAIAATADDGQVFAVTARAPAVYTATVRGFFPREHDPEWTWRWIGEGATWTIVNTQAEPIVAILGIELSAFHHTRRIELRLDGRPVQTFVVEPPRRMYRTDPLVLAPGGHELAFQPVEPPTVAGEAIGNGDPRALSFALGAWSWTVQGEHP